MMITCSAKGCPSSQTTKIDGRPISFYAFPEDDLKNQWLHNCNLASGVNDKEPLHLCELHFERIHFTTSRDLKSSAVPTLFGRIEEPARKHKTESMLQMKVPPLKQRKLDTTAMSSENLSTQRINNTEDSANGNKADVSINNTAVMNGSATSATAGGNCEKNKEVYRLTIQIDKIRGRPGPRCKKLIPLLIHNSDMKDLMVGEHEIKKKTQSLQNVKKVCKQGSCKIRKCIYNSKLAFQCELCNKYYITRKQESQDDKDNSTCHTFLGSPSSNFSIKKLFICDICQTESNTQLMYDKHVRYHVSTDPSYPYKCHLCAKVFELKEDVKQHCLNEHPKLKTLNTLRQITSPIKIAGSQNNYQCISCNITFSNEQAYRNHVNSHKKKESLRAKINETKVFPVSNPLSGSQIGILQPVKFSCNVCSKEFDNVGEVGIHTKTHLEETKEKESLKCNICKKLCKNNAAYNEHMKQHLANAYPCPTCSKAFINKTTLKIHQKTHET
ncbi:zinc finger protein 808-like isoform X2 [Odontomachus brunneus]|uniref:zinc finger protein 808-like isoform X2 n=1 Tax=Odontomachus brunneus TaxID=486640 RepID=UPI0013F192AE|nr:zinc finger protein 808-like isoform X2 [Odontomachus brunneus]